MRIGVLRTSKDVIVVVAYANAVTNLGIILVLYRARQQCVEYFVHKIIVGMTLIVDIIYSNLYIKCGFSVNTSGASDMHSDNFGLNRSLKPKLTEYL